MITSDGWYSSTTTITSQKTQLSTTGLVFVTWLPKPTQLLQFNPQHILTLDSSSFKKFTSISVCDISSSLTEVQTMFTDKTRQDNVLLCRKPAFLILTSRPQMDVASFCPAVASIALSHRVSSVQFAAQRQESSSQYWRKGLFWPCLKKLLFPHLLSYPIFYQLQAARRKKKKMINCRSGHWPALVTFKPEFKMRCSPIQPPPLSYWFKDNRQEQTAEGGL